VPARDQLRDLALTAAQAAADVVRSHARDSDALTPETKSPADYVTAVDRLAEQAAISALRAGSPGVDVLGEEGGGNLAARGWVVDPVDGTTNLVRGFPVVGVSVALVEEGQPVVGAVVAPHLGEWWTAIAGEGAWDSAGARLRVRSPFGSGVVATGFPFRHKQDLPVYQPVLGGALRRFEDLRRAGAACLDLAYTAAGTWDGFFEMGLSLWDIAAGALLVREAGGVVTDWDGDAAAVFRSGDILAGSPECHAALLELTAGAVSARRGT